MCVPMYVSILIFKKWRFVHTKTALSKEVQKTEAVLLPKRRPKKRPRRSVLICKKQYILTFYTFCFALREKGKMLKCIVFYNTKPWFWDAKKASKRWCGGCSVLILGVIFGTTTCISNQQYRTSCPFLLRRFFHFFFHLHRFWAYGTIVFVKNTIPALPPDTDFRWKRSTCKILIFLFFLCIF